MIYSLADNTAETLRINKGLNLESIICLQRNLKVDNFNRLKECDNLIKPSTETHKQIKHCVAAVAP